MAAPILTGVFRYPVKSLRGASHDALEVGRRGFRYDREWMVVDKDGRFLTQRQVARMALIDTRVDDAGRLFLEAPDMPPIAVANDMAQPVDVVVWGDKVVASHVDPAADAWLTRFLGITCRLVRFPAGGVRAVDPAFAAAGDEVGFADGFPFLLISQASLDALNGRLEEPVPMVRFRPNLVVDGCGPHAEDSWRRLRIGDLRLRVAKPCSRCIIPTIDPETAERGPDPLRTLMTYRKQDNKVLFGQNLIHDGEGLLQVGMPVEVLD